MAAQKLTEKEAPLALPVAPSLIDHSIQMRKSGLYFSRALSLHSWERIGNQLLSLANSTNWWIADWLVYGEDTFQDRYAEAIRKTNLNYQTLRNYAWVARRFELCRRLDNLSFCHHAEVAALDRAEQDYWLRKAAEFRWSRNQLRAQVRASLRERQGDTPDEVPGVSLSVLDLNLQLTANQLTLWEAAASGQNLQLQDWAVSILHQAALANVG